MYVYQIQLIWFLFFVFLYVLVFELENIAFQTAATGACGWGTSLFRLRKTELWCSACNCQWKPNSEEEECWVPCACWERQSKAEREREKESYRRGGRQHEGSPRKEDGENSKMLRHKRGMEGQVRRGDRGGGGSLGNMLSNLSRKESRNTQKYTFRQQILLNWHPLKSVHKHQWAELPQGFTSAQTSSLKKWKEKW